MENPRNVYENYNDTQSLVIGIFEYTIRNYYKTYLEKKQQMKKNCIFK